MISKILFILLLIFNSAAFADNTLDSLDEELKSPQATMTTFLANMKKYKMGESDNIGSALKTFDLGDFDPATRQASGTLMAIKLIQTLDRLEKIDVSSIPDSSENPLWVYKKINVEIDGKPKTLEISIAKGMDSNFRFSKKTVSSIIDYRKYLSHAKVVDGVIEYQSLKTKIKNAMPLFTAKKFFLIQNGQWIGIFLILILGELLKRIFNLYLGLFIEKFLARKKITFKKETRLRFLGPIGIMFLFTFWNLTIPILEFEDKILSVLLRLGLIGMTVSGVITIYRFVDVVSLYYVGRAKKSENKFDDILVPLLAKSAKFLIGTFGLIFIGDSLTFDMKNMIAGLGIGGLAFAFAAKDTLSNIFGSLTVLLDRPFQIGDWIEMEGGIEGTVEEVGLRSTRIRTFSDSLITIPNGQLTNTHIDNFGKRTYRLFSTNIGVEYGTSPDLIESFCDGIKQIILDHPDTRKDVYHVYLSGLGSSSLDILLNVFWKVPDRATELKEKHKLLLEIIKLGKKLGVEFAFPTQTLHVFKEN